jgi:hypothetical protein
MEPEYLKLIQQPNFGNYRARARRTDARPQIVQTYPTSRNTYFVVHSRFAKKFGGPKFVLTVLIDGLIMEQTCLKYN